MPLRHTRWILPGLSAAAAALLLAAGVSPAGPAPSSALRIEPVSDKSLGVWEGKHPVLVYNHGILSRKGVPASYNRSSYIHPLYGLDGEIITDDFPKDHYHHRGLFWAWPHVLIDGKEYDSWVPPSLAVKFERWIRKKADAKQAVLEVENGWYTGTQKVAREVVRIVVHPAASGSRAIDLDFTWTALQKPITLRGAEGKSYGGLTMRFAPQDDAAITVPSGRTKKDLAMTRLPWADFTATFPESRGRSGAAIFIARTHPGFPPMWLTRHYGALCVGWPGIKAFTLQPSKPVHCAYRVWVHRGDVKTRQIERAWRRYTASNLQPGS